jgi:deoxyribonuclease V
VEYRIYVSSGEAYIVRLDFSLGDLRPGYILDFDGNLVLTRDFLYERHALAAVSRPPDLPARRRTTAGCHGRAQVAAGIEEAGACAGAREAVSPRYLDEPGAPMSGDPYRWPSSALELERLQTELAERWGTAPRCPVPAGRPLRTAGVFVAFGAGPRGREAAWAAAVVMEAGRVLATAVVRGRANAPYEPGHLALQRGPLLELAVRKLEVHPDVLLVNATGRDHPRRAGLALNLGAALELPTVGVTDHPLVAAAGEPAPERVACGVKKLDPRSDLAVGGWSTSVQT